MRIIEENIRSEKHSRREKSSRNGFKKKMLQKYSGLISECKIESCARFNLRFSFLWSCRRTQMFLISNNIQTKATTFCFLRCLLLLKKFSIFFCVWSLFHFNIISYFETIKPTPPQWLVVFDCEN